MDGVTLRYLKSINDALMGMECCIPVCQSRKKLEVAKSFSFMLLVAIVSGTRVMAANEEAYAVYTSANSTITFYYDDQKNGREGDKYSLNTGDNTPGWIDDGKQFEKVVFAKSFASLR